MPIVANAVRIVFDGSAISIPVAQTSRLVIEQTPGSEPDVVLLPIHDDYKQDLDDAIAYAKTNNLDFARFRLEFEVADPASAPSFDVPLTTRWYGWFALSVQQDVELESIWILTAADLREALRVSAVSRKYNLRLSNGAADPESLNGGAPWTVEGFVSDMLSRALANMAPNHSPLPFAYISGGLNLVDRAAALTEELPWNLGNAEAGGGGWFSAKVSDMLALIEKAFGLYLIQSIDGNLYLTDNTTTRADIAALASSGQEFSRVQEHAHLARPKEVKIAFEVVKEFAMEAAPVTAPTPTYGLYLTNVMRFPKDILNPLSTDFQWVPLEGALGWARNPLWSNIVPSSFLSDPEKYIAANFFKEMVVPYPRDANGLRLPGGEKIDYINDEIAENWRRTYHAAVNGSQVRWSRVSLGRLTAAGGTKDGGMVFADYTLVRRRGLATEYAASGQPAIFSAVFSESIALSDWERQPARMRAFWMDPDKLILHIAPDSTNRLIVKGVVPGLMETPLSFGKFAELAADASDDPSRPPTVAFVKTAPRGSLKKTFSLRVIAFGCPMRHNERLVEFSRTIDPAGLIPTLRLKASGVFAYYAFDENDLTSTMSLVNTDATVLLNQAEIDEICDRVKEEVLQSYNTERYFGVKLGGTKTIESIQAGGECNKAWIEVGFKTSFSQELCYSIKPGSIVIKVKRKDLDGEPIKVAV